MIRPLTLEVKTDISRKSENRITKSPSGVKAMLSLLSLIYSTGGTPLFLSRMWNGLRMSSLRCSQKTLALSVSLNSRKTLVNYSNSPNLSHPGSGPLEGQWLIMIITMLVLTIFYPLVSSVSAVDLKMLTWRRFSRRRLRKSRVLSRLAALPSA